MCGCDKPDGGNRRSHGHLNYLDLFFKAIPWVANDNEFRELFMK